MKNEYQQQSIQSSNLAKCSKGNQATMVCSSQHCTNKAFVCIDEKCDCRSIHQLCVQLSISSIMKIINAHSFSLEPLAEKIQSLFDNAIDKLSDERDKILSEIKLTAKYRYLGLTQLQKKLVDVVKQGFENEEINCKVVWALLNEFKGQKRISQNLTHVEKLLDKINSDIKKQSIDHISNIKKLLQKLKRQSSLQDVFQKSKIIKDTQDEDKIIAFFSEKKVESTKLLYRASENEFLISKWNEKCGNIANTLTIAETQLGKVIGGFTAFKWQQNNNYISVVNDEKNHFIFSLTNNDKFTITKNHQYGIYGYGSNDLGASFGGGHDFTIGDKANINNKSYANICHTYTNAKYTYNDSNSQMKFSGGKNFKVKQWEVWQIQFRE